MARRRITDLNTLAGALNALADWAKNDAKREAAEKLEEAMKERIFERGEASDGGGIGTYSANTTRVTGQSGRINVTKTGALKSAFRVKQFGKNLGMTFGAEKEKAVHADAGFYVGHNAPVFVPSPEEEDLINEMVGEKMKELGL